MIPVISIITPCYNHGHYIEEAIESIDLKKYGDVFEIIIVNDGSTDSFTLDKLAQLRSKGFQIIDQANQGLAAARNTGIAAARGKYILPLDCDNKIVPETMIEGLSLMQRDGSLAVLYTDANYFGNKTGYWRPAPFSIFKLLEGNYIDACALIRKDVVERLGGYDSNMPAMGHEDWDLWLKIAFSGGQFYHLQKVGFHYRVASNSMSETSTIPGIEINKTYLFAKHAAEVSKSYSALFRRFNEMEYDFGALKNRLKRQRVAMAIKTVIGRRLW